MMEQRAHEPSEQAVKCKNNQSTDEKPSDLESNIVSRTPVKANDTLTMKRKAEAAELPRKYKTISELFDGMTSSIRLLNLRKKSPTFQNICRQVQILTKRMFSYKHLAQIKYILPEAVQTDRILIHDEKTVRMKPEMIITLLFDIVEGHDEQSDYLALRGVFTSRLFKFIHTHTENCEIPEAALPEPFNKNCISISANSLLLDSSAELLLNLTEDEIINSSHLHSSFSRHFSQKDLTSETEKSPFLASPAPLSSVKYDSLTDTVSETESPDLFIKPIVTSNPIESTHTPSFISGSLENTPIKFTMKAEKLMVETPAENLMVETPAQLTPQRSLPSCDKLKTTSTLQWTPSISAKRTLDFSYSEGEGLSDPGTDGIVQHEVANNMISQEETKDIIAFMEAEDIFSNLGTDGILQHEVAPEVIPQEETKDIIAENKVPSLTAPLLEVSSSSMSKDNLISQSGSSSCHQTSSCLPDLVAIINHIFQYTNYSSITKEELVHKIIMNSLDIIDGREVDDQIEMLEKLVPDWIGKKLAPSGDILYNIKKVSDLKSICEKLICI